MNQRSGVLNTPFTVRSMFPGIFTHKTGRPIKTKLFIYQQNLHLGEHQERSRRHLVDAASGIKIETNERIDKI